MSKVGKSGQHHGKRIGIDPLRERLTLKQEERRVFKMLRRAMVRRVEAVGSAWYQAADERVAVLVNRLSSIRERLR